MAFFRVDSKPGAPYFLAAKWPIKEGESVLAHDKYYATAEAPTPEECVAKFREKMWGGL